VRFNYPLLFSLTVAFMIGSSYVSADNRSIQTSAVQASPPVEKLFIPTDGVALSQFPSYNRLSQSVLIELTSDHEPINWTSTSNQTWLTATPSGMTGQLITLTATPGHLKQNTAHFAIVTVSSSDLGPTPVTATIRVSLWVGSTDPQTVTISQQTVSLAANPVEPWVYVSSGTPSIEVLNVYTGTAIATFSEVAPTIGQMIVSPNGYILFVVDTTNYKIIELNASTGAEIASFALDGPIASDFSFAYARPNAVGTLFAPGQSAINVATGNTVSEPISIGIPFYDPLIRATPDGTRLAIVERGLSPGSLYTFSVTGPAGVLTITEQQNATITGENCAALAFSSDGSRLYPACGYPYEFDVYDWSTLKQVQTLPAVPYPNNATFDSLGDFVGGVNGIYQTDDVFVFNTAGFLLGAIPTTSYSSSEGQGSDLLVTSGDSTRVISVTDVVYNSNQTLMFRNLPP